MLEPRVITEAQLEDMFEDYLNDVYGTVKIAGTEFDTARAYYKVDPIAYRGDMLAYADHLINYDGYKIEGF
jgi:hypothetical protein